jgi:signal transduction histidine kinase
MKERVKLLDGIFDISTIEGKGTTVRVEMPYEAKVKQQ